MLQKKSYWSMYIWPLLWVMILLWIDLWTKYLFYDLAWYQEFYRLDPVMNLWVSFSRSVPYRVVIPLSLWALWWFLYLYQSKLFSKLVILLLVSWTLWNLYDRIVYDGVRDFFVMPNMFIFNFADIFLSLGMCLALYYVIFVPQKNNYS